MIYVVTVLIMLGKNMIKILLLLILLSGCVPKKPSIPQPIQTPQENLPPVWAFEEYNSGIVVNDITDNPWEIVDLNTLVNDPNNDPLKFEVVAVTSEGTPLYGGNSWWDTFYIENGVLKTSGLQTKNPTFEFLDDTNIHMVIVSVRDEDTDDFYNNTIEIKWYFDDIQL